jgi:ribose transport system substrate-binding protein
VTRSGWLRRVRAVALGGLFAVAAGTSVSCPRQQLNAIAVVPKGTTHEFWKSVHAGANRAGQEARVQILWKGPLREDDRVQQIQAVETFANMNVLGIALAPLDSKALVPAAREVAGRHIPLVIFDSDLASDDKLSFVATDNFHGGQLAGQYLGQLLAGQASARVAMLRYQEGSDSTNQREKGFLDAIAALPNIKIVSSNQYGGATTESAFKASENLLAAQTTAAGATLQGIFCPNESTAFGMLRALEDHRLAGKVRFIGFDTSDKLVEALRQSHMDATVVQDPMQMGYLAVKTILDHLRGGVVKKRVDTGATLVRREEIDDPKMKELLFPDYKKWLKE